MKKQKISKKLMTTKWFVLLVVTVVLLVFARTIDIGSLTKAGIILGLGIDYVEQEFVVSAQVVVVSSSASGGGSTSYVMCTEKDKTVSGAIDKIGQKMGLSPTLSHTNVLVLSQTALAINHLQLLFPLTNKLSMPEQAVVVTGALSPEDILSKRMATTVSAPFYLQSELLHSSGSNGVVRVTLKDFMAKTASRSQALFIPYIESVPLDEPPLTDSGDKVENSKFSMSKTLVFNQAKTAVMDENFSKVASLYNSDNISGTLRVVMKTGEVIEFRVIKKSQKTKVDDRSVSSKISLSVAFLEVVYAPASGLTASSDLIQSAAVELGLSLSRTLAQCSDFSKQQQIDFLGLENLVYQKIGLSLEKNCLDTISFVPTFEIKIKQNS